MLGKLPNVGKSIRSIVHGVDDSLKHLLIPGKFFQDLGIRYLGPIDGHDINAMLEIFNSVKKFSNEPVLVHIITKKGKGYRFAEENPTKFHGVGSFSKTTGEIIVAKGKTPSYSEIFGSTLSEIAATRPEVVAITRQCGMEPAWKIQQRIPGPVFRRRHRRIACGYLCRRTGAQRASTGCGALFNLPAAHLRSTAARCGARRPPGRLLHRPGRTGRR